MPKVLVAMSGGVDSSVAALLLKQQGYEVHGVHMKLHDEVKEVVPKSCCGQQDALDAGTVCNELNIPYFVTDYRTHFKKFVIDNFVQEYENGRTPIPCTHCNGSLKFDLLLNLASALGIEYVATGHYAKKYNSTTIERAKDKTKDQTYFLFPIKRENLPRILFPIGSYYKSEIRQIALDNDLITAEKPESQNLCFAPGGTHKEFLNRIIKPSAGFIKHENGTVLGPHHGIHNFTLGQRKGLGPIAGTQPLFVSRIDPTENTIWVSEIQEPNRVNKITIKGWNSLVTIPENHSNLSVVVRYRKQSISISKIIIDCNETIIHTNELVSVTPGQAAVVYSGNLLIGGGWIH